MFFEKHDDYKVRTQSGQSKDGEFKKNQEKHHGRK
jgi:hypothetical protein